MLATAALSPAGSYKNRSTRKPADLRPKHPQLFLDAFVTAVYVIDAVHDRVALRNQARQNQ